MYYRIDGDLFRDRFEEDEPAVTGDKVVIIDGPFCGFDGKITEIDDLQSLAVVEITVFGRETPVTVDCREIKKSSH